MTPKWHSFRSTISPFPRYLQFVTFLLATMLNFNRFSIFFYILNFRIPKSILCGVSENTYKILVENKHIFKCKRNSALKFVFLEKIARLPKMTVIATRSKVPHICSTGTPDSQISLPFALRSLAVQITDIFCFPIYGTTWNFENQRTKNSNIPNLSDIVRIIGRKILEYFPSRIVGVTFEIFIPLGSHVSGNEKKSLKFQFSKFHKSQTLVLWGPFRR